MKNGFPLKSIFLTSPSLCFILVLTLVLGRPLLIGFPKGNDTPFHLSYVYYIDKYFPHISQWFYKEGCGYPFLGAYPPASYYLTFFTHKIFDISILDSCKIVALASVFSAGLGIYILVRAKFKDERIALLSAILYLITPASWSSFVEGGLFPQQIALPFMFFTLFFIELYQKTNKRIYLAMTSFCMSLSVLTHSFVGLVATPITLVLYLAAKAFSKELSLKRATVDLVKVGFLSLFLTAFWLLPSFTIFGAAGGRKEYVISQLSAVSPEELLGFRVYSMWRLSTIVDILALIGITSSAGNRKFLIWLATFSGLFMFISAGPRVNIVFGSLFFFLYQYADAWRYMIPALIFLPIVAGFGVVNLADKIARLVSTRKQFSLGKISKTGSLAFALLLILSLSYLFGVRTLSWNVMDENREWGGQPGGYATVGDILENVTRGRWDNFTRIDISPSLAPIMESFTILSDVSQENSYFFAGTGWRMYGYKQAVYYGRLGGKTEVKTLARWWGTQYIILNETDPAWKFQDNGFTEIWKSDDAFRKQHYVSARIVRFDNSTRLVTVKDVSTVLVIGSEEHDAYETVFHTAVMAGIDPESSYVIQGSGFVDDYSLEELKTFDAILLHGYNYHDSIKAWALLDKYVASGGSLFIETGWQYVNPDWNNIKIPSPCPVSKTFWTNYGKEWHFSYVSSPVTNGINFSAFSPPIWEDLPWSLSSTSNESVREWAEPVLWNEGHPLIVIGEYGKEKGKVVWSGMNLIPHASDKYNTEELKLFAKILEWITYRHVAEVKYEISRPTSDKIVVSVRNIDGAIGVLFREVNYPDWHAYVEETNLELKIYSCGPYFMYVKIPEGVGSSYSIVFEYKKSWIEWGSILLSVTTFSLLTIYVLIGKRRDRFLHAYVFHKIKSWWYKEEQS